MCSREVVEECSWEWGKECWGRVMNLLGGVLSLKFSRNNARSGRLWPGKGWQQFFGHLKDEFFRVLQTICFHPRHFVRIPSTGLDNTKPQHQARGFCPNSCLGAEKAVKTGPRGDQLSPLRLWHGDFMIALECPLRNSTTAFLADHGIYKYIAKLEKN